MKTPSGVHFNGAYSWTFTDGYEDRVPRGTAEMNAERARIAKALQLDRLREEVSK